MEYIPTDEDVNIIAAFISSEVEKRWSSIQDELPFCLANANYTANQLLNQNIIAMLNITGLNQLKDVPIEFGGSSSFNHCENMQEFIDSFTLWIVEDVETLGIFKIFGSDVLEPFLAKLEIRLFPLTESNDSSFTFRGIILSSIFSDLRSLVSSIG